MLRRYRLLFVAALVSWNVTGLYPMPVTAGGAGGFCGDGKFTDGATTDVAMSEMCFSPTVTRIEPGDTVTFHNKDQTMHMVGGIANGFGSLHTEVAPETSVSYTFKNEGIYPYVCILHPGMGGAIVVGDGEGKGAGAGPVTAAPPADESDEAAVTRPAEAETSGAPGWVVPVALALGVAVLGLAAIPMKRRSGSGAITTKI